MNVPAPRSTRERRAGVIALSKLVNVFASGELREDATGIVNFRLTLLFPGGNKKPGIVTAPPRDLHGIASHSS